MRAGRAAEASSDFLAKREGGFRAAPFSCADCDGHHSVARALVLTQKPSGGRAMASLMLSWGIRCAALGWLALQFCAAIVLGLAIVGAAIVVWAIAGLVVAVIGDEPPKHHRTRYERLSTRQRHSLRSVYHRTWAAGLSSRRLT